MRLELVKRPQVSAWQRAAAPIAALIVAFLLGGLMMLALGRSPTQAFRIYIVEPLLDPWSRQEILIKATPLVLIAIGLSHCFRANLWNIGAEGQFIVGALLASWVALNLGPSGVWAIPLLLLLGALGGALYGAIPALLKVRFGVSEILTSLMLVYIAELLLDYLVRGPWRDPKGFNFPQTRLFDDSLHLPTFGDDARLHLGVALMFIAVIVAWIVMGRTLFGYRLRVSGDAPRAARFAGFDIKPTTIIVFLISGALAGLAGIVEVLGQIHQLKPSISPGYGFTAIIVAFLGRLHPVGILMAGLVLAVTYIGGESAQILMKLPFDVTRAFQGLLLFCVLVADALVTYRLRIGWGRAHA
jgi:simple sugar transport system permease protein